MILGNKTTQAYNEFENMDHSISIESCGYMDIFVEAAEETAALESALFVADTMLEEQVLEGSTEVEILLEGVMSSTFEKLKAIVKKMWAKVKEWFAKVKRFFEILIAHGKDFVKKYEVDIKKAAASCKNFKYKFYPVKAEMNLNVAGINIIGDAAKLAKDAIDNSKSVSEVVTDFCKANLWEKEDSITEFVKKRKEAAFGEEREEFEDFSGSGAISAADMIKLIKEGDKAIKEIEKAVKEIETECKKAVKEIEDKQKGEQRPEVIKALTIMVELTNKLCNTSVALLNCYKGITKTGMKDAEMVLKKLLMHKPAKESYVGEYQDSSSILESALRFI